MILLTTTSDELRLVTRDASSIDVHATYADLSSGVVTPGRKNTAITTATTTVIAASPAASTQRTIKKVTIRNKHVTRACWVTVVHRQSGPTDAEIQTAMLAPGTTLSYEEHQRWRRLAGPFGYRSRKSDFASTSPAIGQLYTHFLGEDVSNANATANRLLDVPALGFYVVEGQRYWFRFVVMYSAAATTTGSRWSIYGPGSPTALRYVSEYSLTTTSKTSIEGSSAYDIPAAANATSAATGQNTAFVAGFVDTPTQSGKVYLRFASEVLSSAITILRGSCVQWMRTT